MSRILVLGDAMLDVHEFGTSDRLSPEAPVPIIRVHKQEKSFGGAANVAAHIKSAGIRTIFAYKASMHSNSHEKFASDCLNSGIQPEPLYMNKKFPLTIKHRIWSGKQQVCRKDQEDILPPSDKDTWEWCKQIQNIITTNHVTLVMFSDYNKGTLTDVIINSIADYCGRLNIPTILDPKRPTFYTLKGLTIIKPNNKELSSTNLTPIECSKKLGDTFLVHTQGKEGMTAYHNGEKLLHHPTVSQEVFDVTGCGDSVCAMLGIAMEMKVNYNKILEAANKAASYTIKHLGCYVLKAEEIKECLK